MNRKRTASKLVLMIPFAFLLCVTFGTRVSAVAAGLEGRFVLHVEFRDLQGNVAAPMDVPVSVKGNAISGKKSGVSGDLSYDVAFKGNIVGDKINGIYSWGEIRVYRTRFLGPTFAAHAAASICLW